jgi:hypothetical protein
MAVSVFIILPHFREEENESQGNSNEFLNGRVRILTQKGHL